MAEKPLPNPDKVALLRTGAHVRRRLDAVPGIDKVPVTNAEIWTLGGFVSPAECETLMKMVDRTARPSATLNHGYREVWRTSYSGDVEREDPFVQMIERRIDDLIGIPHEWGETMQGQRYQPGQEFKQHNDWFWTKADYWKAESKRGGQRSFTAMLYLNDVTAGGETHFINAGASIAPQAGGLVIWNNATPDGVPNPDTLHAGCPVIEGTKYVITKWYRTRPWRPAAA